MNNLLGLAWVLCKGCSNVFVCHPSFMISPSILKGCLCCHCALCNRDKIRSVHNLLCFSFFFFFPLLFLSLELLQYSQKRGILLSKCETAGTSSELDGSLNNTALPVNPYHCSILTSNSSIIDCRIS